MEINVFKQQKQQHKQQNTSKHSMENIIKSVEIGRFEKSWKNSVRKSGNG